LLGRTVYRHLSKRKTMTALLGCLMIIVIWWALYDLRQGASQEARYCAWVRRGRLIVRLQSLQHRLPTPLARPARTLVEKEIGAHYTQEAAFRASGFLTNVCIPLRRATVLVGEAEAEIGRRIHKAVPDNGFIPVRLRAAEDHLEAVITCRSKDVAPVTEVVRTY
jgi:hypothetical protein